MAVSKVHRLLRLIVILQGGRPRTAAELMDELGVSRRTLFRDLRALSEAGVPYYHQAGEGYRIGRGFFLPPVNLTVPETLGLMLLAEVAAAQRKAPLLAPALSAVRKLVSNVPEAIRDACADLASHVSVQAEPRPAAANGEEQHFRDLQRYIDEGRCCRVRYTSPVDGSIELVLHPYLLHFAARAWYVLGHSELHDEVRVLKLARLHEVLPLEERFTRPRDFRAESKLGLAWQLNPEGEEHDVVLDFTPKVATNVSEVRWHASQQVSPLPGAEGHVRLTFRVDGLNEIAWWICGYADQVIVREPPALAALVAEMHRRAAGRYAEHGGTADERG